MRAASSSAAHLAAAAFLACSIAYVRQQWFGTLDLLQRVGGAFHVFVDKTPHAPAELLLGDTLPLCVRPPSAARSTGRCRVC